MGNTSFATSSIARGPHPWRRQIHRGYVDAQNGRAWPDEYERMSRAEQVAYEQGRLLAREAIAEGFGLPVWRGDKAGCVPVDDLWIAVSMKLARPLCPPEWQPGPAA